MNLNRRRRFDGQSFLQTNAFACRGCIAGVDRILSKLFGIESDIGSTANTYASPLIPAGYAFVIWLYLYGGCLFYADWHLTRSQNAARSRTAWWAFAAFTANAVWAYHQPVYSGTFVSLLLLEAILLFAFAAAIASRADPQPGQGGRIAYAVLFALAGWIAVASAPGLSIALEIEGVSLFGANPQTEALLIVVIWSALALPLTFVARSYAFALPVVWGLVAVAAANPGRPALVSFLIAASLLVLVTTWISRRRWLLKSCPAPSVCANFC